MATHSSVLARRIPRTGSWWARLYSCHERVGHRLKHLAHMPMHAQWCGSRRRNRPSRRETRKRQEELRGLWPRAWPVLGHGVQLRRRNWKFWHLWESTWSFAGWREIRQCQEGSRDHVTIPTWGWCLSRKSHRQNVTYTHSCKQVNVCF